MPDRDEVPELERIASESSSSDKNATERLNTLRSRRMEILRLCVLVVLGISGAWFYLCNERQVFPSASIDLKCNKQTILKKAIEWGKKLGYDKSRTIESTYFSPDGEGKTFLEYEMGTEKANSLMMKEIPIWYWQTRICQEFQDEEFRASLSPGGDLVALHHYIPNDLAMPSLTQEQAETLAHEFVEKQAGISLGRYKSVEKSSDILSHRTDHSFTWQDESRDYNGAHLRVYVGVSGKGVSSFNRYLHVPEKWDRKFSTVRTYNQLLRTIAEVFSSLLEAAASIAFVYALSTGNIRWRFALAGGAIFACFGFMESINDFNSAIAGYNTTRSFTAFVLQYALGSCLAPFGMFIYGCALGGTGEYLYRLCNPEKPALERVFSLQGLATKPVLVAIMLGYVLCCIDLGWAATYYLTGYKMGYWCPLGVENYQTLSTYCPFLSAMYTGVMAASMEEIVYRVVGLGLIQRVVKHFWIANLLQAIIWGFMHSTYPQQPCYARGIELTLEGMFYGWIFRRYGLLPCFVSHYLYDAYCGVRPLLSSSSVAWTAAIPLLPFALPAFIGLWLVKKHGRFAVEGEIANRNIPMVKREYSGADPAEKLPYEYTPLSRRWRIALVIGAILAITSMAFIKGRSVENLPVLKVSRHEAVVAARLSLDNRKISRKGMHETVSLTHSTGYMSSLQYIYENSGFAKTAELHRNLYLGYIWTVRFFRSMEAQEYRVTVSGATGKEYGFTITSEEDAAGATITKQEARRLAENYLQANHPEYCPFVFDSSTETKRKNRTDHTIVFTMPRYKVGEADFKVSVEVVGNVVSSFWGDWSIPAKWTFEYNKSNIRKEIISAVSRVVAVICLAALIWWAIGVVRSGVIRWRQAIICAIPLGLLEIVSYINELPEFLSGYSTTTPMSTYIWTKLLGYCGGVFSSILGYVFLFSLSLGVLRLLFPRFSIASLLRTTFLPIDGAQRLAQRQIWLDAVIVSYCFNLIGSGKSHLVSVLSSLFSPYMHTSSNCGSICSEPNYLNYLLSQVDFSKGISACLAPLLVAGIYIRYVKSVRVLVIFVVFFALLGCGTERYWQEFLIDSGSILISCFMYWLLMMKCGRTNALAYMLMTLISSQLDDIAPFVRFGGQVFLSDTIQLVIYALLPIVYAGYLFLARGDNPPAAKVNSEES